MSAGVFIFLFLCMVAWYTIYDYMYPVDSNLIWHNHSLTIVLRLFLALILGFLLMIGLSGLFVGIVMLADRRPKKLYRVRNHDQIYSDKDREDLK